MSVNTETCFKTFCTRKPFSLKAASNNGTILNIHHLVTDHKRKTSIRFLQATFNSTGELLALFNHIGKIYVFDFTLNKYYLLAHQNCSIIKFIINNNVKNKDMLLAGATNGHIHIINSVSGARVTELYGHRSPITDVSFSDNEQCITISNNSAMIWNLKTYMKLQILHLEENTGLKFVMFIPKVNDIIACFQDETMQIWKSKSYKPVKELKPEHITETYYKFIIRSVSFTNDGEQMAIVGHSMSIYIFRVKDLMLTKEHVFTDIYDTIKKAQYLITKKEILVFLTSKGTIFVYNTESESIINSISLESEIWKFATDPIANKLLTINKSGAVDIYSLDHIMKKTNKPKSVIVAVKRKSNKKKKVKKKIINTLIAEEANVFDTAKLQAILKQYKQYPNMYRKIIWSHILQLPNDMQQFEVISKNAFENKLVDFEKKYPLEVKQDMKNLKNTMGNLISWCPFLSVVNYLPVLVFPFVKYLHSEPVMCLETLILIIVNYCQYWFEYHPVPPLNILRLVDSILIQVDAELISHLNKNGVTSKTYAWILLQTFFSEVLPAEEWLIFIDHVFSNEPAFLIVAVAAYSLVNKTALLNLNHLDDFNFFFRTTSTFDFKRFISRCYNIFDNTLLENHPRNYLSPLLVFKHGKYPIFDRFPKNCLEVCKSINQLRSQTNELKEEEELAVTKSMEFSKLKELERTTEEYTRQIELNKLYCEKICEEKSNLNKQRDRVQRLNTSLSSKVESSLETMNDISKFYNKSAHSLQQDAKITNHEQIESDLLNLYTNLLKHKIQIEGLIDDNFNFDFIQLRKNYKRLVQEVDKKSSEVVIPRTEYLKQLNVMTGLSAVNSLIEKMESKLSTRDTNQDKTDRKEMIFKLASESERLSEEINKLMQLISSKKNK